MHDSRSTLSDSRATAVPFLQFRFFLPSSKVDFNFNAFVCETYKMERKEVDTQQFIDHVSLCYNM